MPDPRPTSSRSSPAPQVPPSNGRPVRKDEIELHDRGLYIESWLPERRSRRKPLLFVHGELAGRGSGSATSATSPARGWEGHALNLRNHYWSQTADPTTLVVRHLHRGRRRGRSSGSGRRPWSSATGWAACSRSRPPSGCRSPASCCSAPSCRASCVRRPGRTSCARCRRSTGAAVIGWETLPEKLLRDDRDLTLADVLRIQHLLGQKPHEAGAARRQMLAGVPVDRRGRRRGAEAGHRRRPGPHGPADDDVERLAEWLGAEYEPFGAHSHYGLVARRAELPAGRRGDPRRSSRRTGSSGRGRRGPLPRPAASLVSCRPAAAALARADGAAFV